MSGARLSGKTARSKAQALGSDQRQTSRAASVLALAVGSVPGFTLSFSAAAFMPSYLSDVFLIGITSAIVLGTLLASTYEACAVASFGRALAQDVKISRRSLNRLRIRGVGYALPLAVSAFPLLLLSISSFGSFEFIRLLAICSPAVLFPIVATYTAANSAFLIANRKFVAVFLTLAFRGLFPGVALLVTSNISALILVYALGELTRGLVLGRSCDRLLSESSSDQAVGLSYSSWVLQVASMSMAQVALVISKSYIAIGPSGSITAADNADKIYFALNQIVLSGFILPSIAQLPKLIKAAHSSERVVIVLKQGAAVFLASTALVVPCVVALALLREFSMQSVLVEFDTAIAWSMVLVLAVPALSVNVWGARALLLFGRPRLILVISAFSLVCTFATCSLLFAAADVLGVFWAIVVTQWLVGAAYVGVLLRAARVSDPELR